MSPVWQGSLSSLISAQDLLATYQCQDQTLGNTFFSLTKVNVNVDIKFNIYLKSNTMAPYIESHYRFYSRLDLAFQIQLRWTLDKNND